jgi:hypothetical protein
MATVIDKCWLPVLGALGNVDPPELAEAGSVKIGEWVAGQIADNYAAIVRNNYAARTYREALVEVGGEYLTAGPDIPDDVEQMTAEAHRLRNEGLAHRRAQKRSWPKVAGGIHALCKVLGCDWDDDDIESAVTAVRSAVHESALLKADLERAQATTARSTKLQGVLESRVNRGVAAATQYRKTMYEAAGMPVPPVADEMQVLTKVRAETECSDVRLAVEVTRGKKSGTYDYLDILEGILLRCVSIELPREQRWAEVIRAVRKANGARLREYLGRSGEVRHEVVSDYEDIPLDVSAALAQELRPGDILKASERDSRLVRTYQVVRVVVDAVAGIRRVLVILQEE